MGGNRFHTLFLLFSLGILLSLKHVFGSNSSGFSDAKVKCIKKESQALLKFKQSLVDHSGLLSSWDNGEDNKECCKWWGVKCSNRTGHVIILDLHRDESSRSDGRIFSGGEVSLSLLAGLQHLRVLDLSWNDFFESEKVEVIGSFHRLRYLNLSKCGFSGAVPPQLGNLSNLQSLDLGWNNFEIDNLVWLSQLRLLRRLDLSWNDLNINNWEQVIFNLPFLEELYLSFCELNGLTSPSLPLLLNSSSKSLSILDLSENYLNSSSTYYWLFNISKNLVSIDLSSNDLEGPIPHAFGEMKDLVHMDLSFNDLEGSIPHAFGEMKDLVHIDLSFNDLEGPIPHAFGDMKDLVHIDLSHNDLKGSIPHAFGEMKNLVYIDLSHNDLEGSIPHAFGEMKDLVHIDLSSNRLEGSIPRAFGEMMKDLVHIDLSSNHLEGSIPDAIGEVRSLENINMANNRLTGGIPKSFRNLNHLRSLDLTSNDLSQSFPELLETFSKGAESSLEELGLSDNQFYGPFSDITRFSSLWNLTLKSNRLNGSMMNNFVLPPSLVVLDLSNNQIAGNLTISCSSDGVMAPSNLSLSSPLRELFLNNNNFTGRIPESIGQFPKLRLLDLSSNLFQGTITEIYFSRLSILEELRLSDNKLTLNIKPDWIPIFQLNILDLANCNMGPHFPQWLRTQDLLSVLDISSNGISDTVPNWFWNLSRSLESLDLHGNMFGGSVSFLCVIINSSTPLKYLDLSANLFTGDLADCWMNMEELRVLSLGNNDFSGRIPESFGYLQQLRVLNLVRNSFVGEFFSTIRNCTSLEVIDVEGNDLSGNIPSWIGTHLRDLLILGLRLNNFSGNIPQDICQLSRVQVLDLSSNSITGHIPKCFNNFTSLAGRIESIRPIEYGFMGRASVGDTFVVNMLVQWKGHELEYKETLALLKIIDLSNNKLVGQIPGEIANLKALISLNLSVNHLTGKIFSNIYQMETLESLDLSRNRLSGEIPTDLARLNFLAFLNLSYNNLSGKIPTSTQLQSFNTSAYIGNSGLCGLPLNKCPGDDNDPRSVDHGKDDNVEDKDAFMSKEEFYIGMGLGFLVGLWGFVAVLIKGSWRNAYFRFLKFACDWFYVRSMIYWLRLKRTISG